MSPSTVQSLRSIVRRYGMRTYRVRPCRSVYKETAAYRVLTDRGTFFLKPFQGPKERLIRVYARVSWLRRNNFKWMPKWIATNKGKPWTNKNGRLYYISEWIDGEPLGGDARDYAKLGETLALLHTMSRRRRPASSSFSIRDIARLQRHNRIFASDLRAVRTKPGESGNWYSKHGLQCLKLAEDAWRILSGSDVERTLRSERPTLIHGDVTRPNVIVGRHGLYLVDWELARFGSAYYEAAKALSNVAYFSIPNMRAFLAGYENYSPLSQEERRIIAALFRLPREAWIVAAQLRSGSQAPLLNVLKAAWNDRMQAVRWMDGWADEQPEKIGVVMHMATMEEEAGNEFDRRH